MQHGELLRYTQLGRSPNLGTLSALVEYCSSLVIRKFSESGTQTISMSMNHSTLNKEV